MSHFWSDPYWEILGLGGQFIFGSRFLYQWFASEKANRSIMPIGFWWLSLIGSVITFVYATHKGSIAFMIPTLTGLPVYLRNLMLIQQEKKKLSAASPPDQGN